MVAGAGQGMIILYRLLVLAESGSEFPTSQFCFIMAVMDVQLTADYDSPWKEILEHFFPEFMAFFFSEAHAAIDWKQGYTFLDKELQQVVREAETGRRHVDKLVQVTLHGHSSKAWVLIHVEVQGDPETAFARRMYIYNYRLFDRYERQVASLAILADDNPTWRPTRFEYQLLGSRVLLDFPAIKLLDYESHWAELEAVANPFAVVVMAHLQTRRTRQQAPARYAAKLQLARLLYERNYRREEILELFRFIDWVMTLPPELEEQFMSEIVAYEAQERKPYITSVERIAQQRGLEQGMEQGMRVMLLETLETRFGPVPAELVARLEQIPDPDRLKRLQQAALLASSLAAFEQQPDLKM
jgi:hypothetical protein